MNESPNLKQMDHLLESKHDASVPCLQSEFNDADYSHYKNPSLQLTEGFVQKVVKIATSFSALKMIIQFTEWWDADNFPRVYEFPKIKYTGMHNDNSAAAFWLHCVCCMDWESGLLKHLTENYFHVHMCIHLHPFKKSWIEAFKCVCSPGEPLETYSSLRLACFTNSLQFGQRGSIEICVPIFMTFHSVLETERQESSLIFLNVLDLRQLNMLRITGEYFHIWSSCWTCFLLPVYPWLKG